MAISLRSKAKVQALKSHELTCDECGMSYAAAKDTQIPESINKEINFLKELAFKREPISKAN